MHQNRLGQEFSQAGGGAAASTAAVAGAVANTLHRPSPTRPSCSIAVSGGGAPGNGPENRATVQQQQQLKHRETLQARVRSNSFPVVVERHAANDGSLGTTAAVSGDLDSTMAGGASSATPPPGGKAKGAASAERRKPSRTSGAGSSSPMTTPGRGGGDAGVAGDGGRVRNKSPFSGASMRSREIGWLVCYVARVTNARDVHRSDTVQSIDLHD